jgi:hypothetical protein
VTGGHTARTAQLAGWTAVTVAAVYGAAVCDWWSSTLQGAAARASDRAEGIDPQWSAKMWRWLS